MKKKEKQKLSQMRNYERDLAGPVLAVEVADDAVAGLDGGEEVLLGGDLGVVAVSEGDPTAPLLRHLLHLLQPPLSQRLQIVHVHPI